MDSPPLTRLGISAETLGLVRIEHRRIVTSTMDIAHTLAAAGAPAGVLVLADRQESGRGRSGHAWSSDDGAGVWMTLIERPVDRIAVSVLSLRLGLALAAALQPLVDAPVTLKWPNDVFVGEGKVAGILVEARWRQSAIDWAAIGMGINLRVPPDVPTAASVRRDVSREQILAAVMVPVREAAAREGVLSDVECAMWHDRDRLRGQAIREPVAGIVQGISNDGALRVQRDDDGAIVPIHAGSIVLAVPSL